MVQVQLNRPPPRRTAPSVTLPHGGWQPRQDQLPLWSYLERGGKRAFEFAHRRWGKDDVMLHWGAMASNDVGHVGAVGRVGTYWHLLPSYTQSRKAIWEALNPRTGKRRIDESFPDGVRQDKRDTDMFIRMKCGSTWQVVGSDNFDSLVGTPPVGITFSEYALSDPRCYAYMNPILMENNGWAAFITTPRGRNHAFKMYQHAGKTVGWYAGLHSALDTPVYTAVQLETIRAEYRDLWGEDDGDALFEQEYLVSFDAPLVGAYYAKMIAALERQGHMLEAGIEHDPDYPVETAWDLGHSDDTNIWWFQVIANELRVLRFRSDRMQPPERYAAMLDEAADERGWSYHPPGQPEAAMHHVPWDARPKTLASKGKSLLEIFWEDHKVRMRVVKNISRHDGILDVRRVLKKAWFDMTDMTGPGGSGDGVECLRNYRREIDESRSTPDHQFFKDAPLHDWTSHAADGFRYLAIACGQRIAWSADDVKIAVKKRERYEDVENATFEDLLHYNERTHAEGRYAQ